MSIIGKKSLGFVLDGCIINNLSSTPEETICPGLFCNKQRIQEILGNNQGCAYYSMFIWRSNLTIDPSLPSIMHSGLLGLNIIAQIDFLCFVKLDIFFNFMTGCYSVNKSLLWLCWVCSNSFDFINDDCGFTVIVWYKKDWLMKKLFLVVL